MKTLVLLSFLFASTFTQAQSTASRLAADQNAEIAELKNGRRFITVNGSAETEVTPDIIYLSVTIKEYFTDNGQKTKVPVEDLEKDFLRTVYAAGISSKEISIESISGYGNWGPKRKPESFLASKRYQLKLTDLDKVNNIMGRVDPKAVSSLYISGYDYSKLDDIKKSLRIEAMRNARTKAGYMMAALNETVGVVIEAEEQDLGDNNGRVYMGRMLMEKSADAQSTDLEFKKLKISTAVKIKFQIQ